MASALLLKSCRFDVNFKAGTVDYMLPIRDLGFDISIERRKDYFSCDLSYPSLESINRFLDLIANVNSANEENKHGYQGLPILRTGTQDNAFTGSRAETFTKHLSYPSLEPINTFLDLFADEQPANEENEHGYQGLPTLRTETQDNAFTRPGVQAINENSSKKVKIEEQNMNKNDFDKSFKRKAKTRKEKKLYPVLEEILNRNDEGQEEIETGENEEDAAANSYNKSDDKSFDDGNNQGDGAGKHSAITMLIFSNIEYELALWHLAQSDSMKYLKEAYVLTSEVIIDVKEDDACSQELLDFKKGLKREGIFLDEYNCVKQVQDHWGKQIVVESCDDQFLLTAPGEIHKEIKNHFPKLFKSDIVPLFSIEMDDDIQEGLENAPSLDNNRSENDLRASEQVEAIEEEKGQSTNNDSFEVQHRTLVIKLHRSEIAQLSVDVIVTAINDQFKHFDDVGESVTEIASRNMTEGFKKFIAQNGKINVTQHFVANSESPQVKQVYYACVPDKSYYLFKSDLYKRDLRQTILWCLMHAEHQGHNSIAFPITIGKSVSNQISTAILAESYMKAIRHFEMLRVHPYTGRVQEIHFVDADAKMVNSMKKYFVLSKADNLTTTSCPDYKDDIKTMNEYMKKLITRTRGKVSAPDQLAEGVTGSTGSRPAMTIADDSNGNTHGGARPKTTTTADQLVGGATGSNGSRPDMTIADHSLGNSHGGARPKTTTTAEPSFLSREECPICMDNRCDNLKLSCCQNKICKDCDVRCKKCPFCRESQRTLLGHMPPGTMSILHRAYGLPLFDFFGQQTYEITYSIPSWSPKEYTADIEVSSAGLKSLMLCIVAFQRKLTFTRGLEKLNDNEDKYVWRFLHRRFSSPGNQEKERHISEVPLNLQQLDDLLNSMRVTLGTVNEAEQQLIEWCQKRLLSCKFVQIGS